VKDPKLKTLLNKLIDHSVDNYYNPYREFQWSESLPKDQYWMSPELLSVFNTPYYEKMNETERIRLSQWEAVNFFSVSTHGIRELLLQVLNCIHRPGFEDISEYFHHFIGEENEHMWFFAQFCQRYGKKFYTNKKFRVTAQEETDLEHFIAFAQILIFEEIGDYFNKTMKDDDRLPPIVRKINRIHHEDESRHIAMGRQVLKSMFKEIKDKHSETKLILIDKAIRGYIMICLDSLYNPEVYKDTGLTDPYAIRNALHEHPARIEFHQLVLARTETFLLRNKILKTKIYENVQ
jgi:hypothetical protein